MSTTTTMAQHFALDDLPSREERAERTADLLERRAAARSDSERRRLVAEIVDVNRGVAIAVARRYRNRGVAFEDLCQTAFEGLTKAVARFDSTLADDLLTFAVPTIRGELQRHFRDHSWAVRPPRRVQELQQRLADETEVLRQRLGREPSCAELAEHLGVTPQQADEALRVHECFTAVSLDQPAAAGSDASLGDFLPLPDDNDAELAEARVSLVPAVRQLPERDRRILYLRFFEDRTQAEIGQVLGVSQMQVSRVLNRVLGQLRQQIA